MFTGIVSGKGHVQKIVRYEDYISLIIKAPKDFSKNLIKGASIAVNGEETLQKTNLKDISKSSKVNLERSMTAKTEIGGHLVSGHIHGTGEVLKVINRQATKDLQIKIPTSLREYFFYKGYVALDGCSLTIGKVLKTSFYIHLIPETVSVTTFKDIKKGDLINIEVEQSTINTVETVKKIMSQRKV